MATNNQNSRYRPVTLVDDPTFLGYLFARYCDQDGLPTNDFAVDVSKPGQTQLRGCVRLPRERLIEVRP